MPQRTPMTLRPTSPPSRLLRRTLCVTPMRRRTPPAPLVLLALAICCAASTLLLSRTTDTPPPRLRTLPEEPSHRPHRRALACPRTRLDSPPVYVFVHLHKTAGNTLKKALFAFSHRNTLTLHHTCHPAMGDSFMLAWWFNRRKEPSASLDCNLDKLASMSAKERDAVDIVMGHQYVGVHTLFPRRDVRYFTFVRHPLSRKVSHYIHFEQLADPVAMTRYLIERNRNYMVKRLATDANAGEIAADLRGRFVDVDSFAARAALRAAKRNLANRFFFVGLQERYEESVCMLARVMNTACGRGASKLAKKAAMRPERMSLLKENHRGRTEEIVGKMNAMLKSAVLRAEAADVELYKFAQRLFEEKLKLYPECRQGSETE